MDESTRPLLLTEIVRPVIEDIRLFIGELQELSSLLSEHAEPLRERLLKEGFIQSCGLDMQQEYLQAVDAASVPRNREGLAIVSAVGARIGRDRQLKVQYDRKSGENSEDFRRVATALRLRLEFGLLHDAEFVTIADHSFWSLLMDANKVCTTFRNSEGDVRNALMETREECFSHNGTFLKTLKNPCLIAISKTASSDRFSSRFGIKAIPDRALFTAILEPGEYTRPAKLIESTRGKFGVERDIVDFKEVESIYKGNGHEQLMVTFFRPWEFQRAYRIEYHDELFNDADKLSQLLARLKYETRFRTIMEPRSQFLVDMVCKQIGEVTNLYIYAAMHRFPGLMGPYRTGGWLQ